MGTDRRSEVERRLSSPLKMPEAPARRNETNMTHAKAMESRGSQSEGGRFEPVFGSGLAIASSEDPSRVETEGGEDEDGEGSFGRGKSSGSWL